MKLKPETPTLPDVYGFFAVPGIFLTLIIIHLGYFPNGFVWHDHNDIEDGRAIIPLVKLWGAFLNPYAATGFYRPMVTVLHSINAAMSGVFGVQVFHVTNVVLHCIAALIVPPFLRCFMPLSRVEGWIASLVFGLHPLGMLVAGWISYRCESLMVIFVFGAVWSYVSFRRSGGWLKLLALPVFCMSACFSKETSFFFIPAFISAWELDRILKTKNPREIKQVWPAAILLAISVALVFFMRLSALPQLWRIKQIPLAPDEAVATRLLTLVKQCASLLSPLPPHFSDAVTVTGMPGPVAVVTALLVFAAAYFFIKFRKLKFTGQLAILFMIFFIAMLPAVNILPLPRFYSPAYAYCAMAPAIGIAVFLVREATRRFGRTFLLWSCIAAACWLLTAAVSTATAGGRFKSDLTLFVPEVKHDARFLEAWFYIGNYYMERGDFEKAWKAFDNSLRQDSLTIAFCDRVGFLINQSFVAAQTNRLIAADSLLLEAQSCAPPNMLPDIAYNRAYIANQRGDYDGVIALLSESDANLRRPESRRMLALALSKKGRDKEAQDIYRRSLR